MNVTRNLDEAMLRAYSDHRCVDYGCFAADVAELRSRVVAGESWAATCLALAQLHLKSNEKRELLYGSACLRLAQASMEDSPDERLVIYRQLALAFTTAMLMSDVKAEKLDVTWNNKSHTAWLYPSGGSTDWVLVWGGADGWCEAYQRSVESYAAQGLSVCLIELPGQGLARLEQHSYLDLDYTSFISHIIDELAARESPASKIALVGHSLGGSLAIRAAACDERILACVTNGGSVEMEKGFTAYPRVLDRFARMLGDSVNRDNALAFISKLALADCAAKMDASLLCIHGGKDELVHASEAERLSGLNRNSTLKTWPDGTHCVYNHADERNSVIAGWIARVMRS